jgi:3-hydroxyisobutyrate dehydrogenase
LLIAAAQEDALLMRNTAHDPRTGRAADSGWSHGGHGVFVALRQDVADSSHVSFSRIGFIGLGGMGSRMVSRLLNAGYRVAVYNRTRRRAEDLERIGASIADSPRALAASAEIVLSSVADGAALAQVMFGDEGALAGARRGSIVVDLSTVHPRDSLRLFEAGLAKGVDVLDAAVSGSLPQAEQGQLVVFVGGEQRVYECCEPLFEVLGKAVYMGPSGSGSTTKLCANTLLGLAMQSLAEAIALGERAGLPRGRLLEALAETSVVSPSQRSKFDNIRRDEYPPTFPLRLMFKDFSLILDHALELAVAMPATAAAAHVAAAERAREAAAHVDDDFSAVVRTMRRSALPTVAAPGPARRAAAPRSPDAGGRSPASSSCESA